MALGQGGKTLNDRKLAADVRTLSLRLIQKYLEGEDEVYKKQLLLRLANTVLPKLNEHSGPDGGEMKISPIYGGQSTQIQEHNSNGEDIQPEETN